LRCHSTFSKEFIDLTSDSSVSWVPGARGCLCCRVCGGGIEASFGSLLLEGLWMDYGRRSDPRQVWTTMVDP
jgi:hypothetical protein